LGGEKAVKEPRRVALSIFFELYGDDFSKFPVEVLKAFKPKEVEFLYKVWQKGVNSPPTSSAGRVFDAASSLLDIAQVLSYEGQSGSIMEDLYDPRVKAFYPYTIEGKVIDWRPLFEELIKDKSPFGGKSFEFYKHPCGDC
jgi:hydrogenase maturation protein HypF